MGRIEPNSVKPRRRPRKWPHDSTSLLKKVFALKKRVSSDEPANALSNKCTRCCVIIEYGKKKRNVTKKRSKPTGKKFGKMAEVTNQTKKMIEVGTRISVGSDRGTVLFHGEVPPTGVWLGVEWDNPARGKHDGVHQGQRYFFCRRTGSGSFIRYTDRVNMGQSFCDALLSKYGVTVDKNDKELYVQSVSNRIVPVEVVGFDDIANKQKQYNQLKVVELNEMLISLAGSPEDIATICPNIEELDLGGNLLSSWQVVAEICIQLPKLRSLNLSQNRFKAFDQTQISENTLAFASLAELFLNQTEFTWLEAERIAQLMPKLTNLHLRGNNIDTFEVLHAAALNNITQLNLDDNHLEWKSVATLAALPLLKQLWLNGNKINKINGEDAAQFSSLQNLSLDRNQIAEWSSIDALDRFPSLRELRIRLNPVTSTADGKLADSCREFIIARVSKLQVLHGSLISARDRMDAELYVLHLLNGNDDARKQFPRYDTLLQLYGSDVATSSLATKDATLMGKLLDITLYSSILDQKITKKLPVDLTIRRLKAMVQKLFPKLRPSSLRLTNGEQDFDDETKTLTYYGVSNGSTVLVDAQESQKVAGSHLPTKPVSFVASF